MASLISPGIVIKERDLTTAVVTNTSSITGAFASTFQRGPVGEITTISSQKEFLDTFGAPKSGNAEDWFVASEFLNYGGRLAVVRAQTGTNSANTGANAALNVLNKTEWDAGLGAGEDFVARSPGTWGNSLKVIVVDRGPDQVLTISAGWDNAPVVGSPVTFNLSGGGTAAADVMAWDAGTRQLTIALADPTTLISTADTLEDGNEIGTFTVTNPGADVNRANAVGSYPGVAAAGGTGGGATFDVTVNGDGSVVVTLVQDGDGYTAGDTLTIADNLLGGQGGADVTLLITALDPDVVIESASSWYATASVSGVKLSNIGPRPGTSAFASARGIEYDELHIAVVDTTGEISGTAGTIIERHQYLSKLSDARGTENQAIYYKTAVNEGSEYVFTGSTLDGIGSGAAWAQESSAVTGKLKLIGAGGAFTLSAGDDDYDYNTGEIDAAYEVFTETEDAVVDFVLMGGSMSDETDTLAKAGSVMAVAQNRKDCIAFVSPYKGNQVGSGGALSRNVQKTNTINYFNQLASTSYAVFDSGYKYMYDRFNDLYRWVPCNGDVAGLCVSTSSTLEDWYSPAGTNRGGLRNAVKLAFNPGQADRDELYQARINPIVSFPGTGVILFGDKTALASPSAFDRINVRRLFLAVQKRAETLAKGVLFEQNDAATRVGFQSALSSYLSEVQSRRGVTDFLVVCDESNNTASVIDRNEFVAEIYMKPTRSINYITVTLTATKTGVSFSEVIGS